MSRLETQLAPPRPECLDCALAVGVDQEFAGQIYCAGALSEATRDEGVVAVGLINRADSFCEATRKLRGTMPLDPDESVTKIILNWYHKSNVKIPPSGPTYTGDVTRAADGIIALAGINSHNDTSVPLIVAADLLFYKGRFSAAASPLESAKALYELAGDLIASSQPDPSASGTYTAAVRGQANSELAKIHLQSSQRLLPPVDARYAVLEVLTDIIGPLAQEISDTAQRFEEAGDDWGNLLGSIGEIATYVTCISNVLDNELVGTDFVELTTKMYDESSTRKVQLLDGKYIRASSDVSLQRGPIVPEFRVDYQVKATARPRHFEPLYEQPIKLVQVWGTIPEFNDFVQTAITRCVLGAAETDTSNPAYLCIQQQFINSLGDYQNTSWLELGQY